MRFVCNLYRKKLAGDRKLRNKHTHTHMHEGKSRARKSEKQLQDEKIFVVSSRWVVNHQENLAECAPELFHSVYTSFFVLILSLPLRINITERDCSRAREIR